VKRCLSDAGLNALAGITGEVGGTPPLTIATEIESVSVDQRFGRQRTIHGQYFSMTAQVKLRFSVGSQRQRYSIATTGSETEPPTPVGGEAFLPLETDPAESLSVALSRAIGTLVLQPEFRRAIQSR